MDNYRIKLKHRVTTEITLDELSGIISDFRNTLGNYDSGFLDELIKRELCERIVENFEWLAEFCRDRLKRQKEESNIRGGDNII